MKQLYTFFTLLILINFSFAQNTIVLWNYENGNASPSEGIGVEEKIGGTQGNGSLEFFDGLHTIHTFPEQGTNTETAGVQFSTSIAGYSDIKFSIDIDGTNGSSKFFEIQSSVDAGATWQLVTKAQHTTLQNEIETFGPYSVSGTEGASNLKIRIVTVFEEGNSNYIPVDSESSYSVWDTYSFDNVLITGTGAGADVYCSYTATTVTPITYVDVAGISNTTSATSTEAHEFFLDKVGNTVHGQEHIIKLSGSTGGDFESFFTVFIDWNKNGILTDDGEKYEVGSLQNSNGSDGQLWGSFVVPMNVTFGSTRMRIISNRGSYATDPCGSYDFGQAEDYTFSVIPVPDDYCTYTAETVLPITNVNFAGINNTTETPSVLPQEYFLDKEAQLKRGQTYNLTVLGDTGGNHTDYYTLFVDWNKNDVLDNAGEIYELGSISNSTGTDNKELVFPFAVANNAPLGDTRMRIIKNRDSYSTNPCGEHEFGQAEEYTLNVSNPTPGNDDYCGPLSYDYGTEPITYVNFAGIDNRTSASPSSPDHEFFLEMKANVDKGEEYEITLEGYTGGGWTNSLTVFIDLNHNGNLNDPGERFEIGTIEDTTGEDGQQLVGNILIPSHALSGETRMRIMKSSGDGFYAEDPCNSDNWGGSEEEGQAEDYTIIINSDCIAPSLTIATTSTQTCEGTAAILQAQTNGGQVFWFTSETATTPIGSGLNFKTPKLSETTSFWAEATSGQFFDGGRPAPQSLGAAQINQTTNPWGLVFNTNEIITLNSVDVYVADTQGGPITVKLVNENWDEVYSKTLSLPAGNAVNPVRFEIPLGFIIPAGDNYRLVMESSPSLVRELATQHTGFPYALGNVGQITGGTINNGGANSNYYFFYNWKFNTGDSECKSERVKVDVTIIPAPDAPMGEATQYFTLGETLANLEVTGTSMTWYANQNGTVIPATTPLVNGTTYYVSQNNGQCESELLAITAYLQLGVSEINKTEFNYYPNPVMDVLNIAGKSNISKVEIFELSGKKVLSQDAKIRNVKLNLSTLISGTYILKVTSSKTTETFKIIKR
ncbi:GEVED domain-containing protein [Chryseobacterium sp. FH1]|uniref:GEVED domain-containing protein n=1 Tax=Chryseobacterium sp. FH1 TaxID=1233951 RepID=UPI0009DE3A35|nr:GEVED domain-containing protein [Chryseobacterium sp. FH1]